MNNQYKPKWFKTPFDHLKYTLVRDLEQCKKIKIDEDLISMPPGANATTNFLVDENGGNMEIVVYLPYADVDLLMQQEGLLRNVAIPGTAVFQIGFQRIGHVVEAIHHAVVGKAVLTQAKPFQFRGVIAVCSLIEPIDAIGGPSDGCSAQDDR